MWSSNQTRSRGWGSFLGQMGDDMAKQLSEAAAELLRTPLIVQQRLDLIGELWNSIPPRES